MNESSAYEDADDVSDIFEEDESDSFIDDGDETGSTNYTMNGSRRSQQDSLEASHEQSKNSTGRSKTSGLFSSRESGGNSMRKLSSVGGSKNLSRHSKISSHEHSGNESVIRLKKNKARVIESDDDDEEDLEVVASDAEASLNESKLSNSSLEYEDEADATTANSMEGETTGGSKIVSGHSREYGVAKRKSINASNTSNSKQSPVKGNTFETTVRVTEAIAQTGTSDVVESDGEDEFELSAFLDKTTLMSFNPRSTHRSTAFGDLHNFSTPKKPPPAVVDFHTPRTAAKSPDHSRSPSPSVEVIEASDEEIIISDDDEPPTRKPPQPPATAVKVEAMPFIKPKVEKTEVSVSPQQFQTQLEKVKNLEADVLRNLNVLRTLNLNSLPDKGQLLKFRQSNLETMLAESRKVLESMVVDKPAEVPATMAKPSSWQELDKFSGAVQPRTFGKQAMATHNQQKALTMDRLKQLHGSLKSCPTEDTFETDPKGLLVELMPHQRHALAWLLWREEQKPSGGILADDMGLGKTLTMISLMLKSAVDREDDGEDENEEDEGSRRKYKYSGGTLIVCPASLIGQWAGEVERRLKRGLVSVELYHGANREKKAKTLSKYDMVVTTYSIVMNEAEKQTPLTRIKWRRIILDEAHQIRNHKSQTSMAVCRLGAKSRWALTGTPIHNKELDLYSLLKFIRVSPFDEFNVFKRWVSDKNAGGQERLNTVMSSLMLRRTKAQLQTKGSLQCLPERHWELISITLDKQEMDVYQKVLIFSRTLFSQFLHQRAEKDQNADVDTLTTKSDPNGEYTKMHRKLLQLNRVKEVKQHEILVLLLRLRQICCHPSLINDMLNSNDIDAGDDVNEGEELASNILDQLNKLNLNDDDRHDYNPAEGAASEGVSLGEATRGLLKPSHPVFAHSRKSTKLVKVIEILRQKVLPNDKAIIVSQWTGLLNILATHLTEEGISYDQLDGKIPVHKRTPIIDNINNPNSKTKVLLLSLTAGGVGLNLVGANHLLLLDLHWNPQLEMQAQDRIYRVGQKKPVHVYKFMTSDTIEERIKKLQEHKMGLAEAMLTGAKMQQSKLSLDDMRMLFNM